MTLVVLLHALLLLALWLGMRPPPPRAEIVHASFDTALQVRFLPRNATAQAAPPPPALAPPPKAPASSRATPRSPGRSPAAAPRPSHEASRSDAMVAQMDVPAPAPTVAPTPQLFDRRGGALLPPPSASAAPPPVPGYVQRKPTGDTQIMQHTSPMTYKATRFEKYFPPPGENLAQKGLRHVLTPLFKQHNVNLPHGTHLKCSLLGGCSEPPPPPPPNDGDERLSMAPVPLAKDPHAKPPPSLNTCIAAYRSQGPLPYGCPVDTPARAVDEEARECVALFLAGKRLKTWCPADTDKRAAAQQAAERMRMGR